MRGLVDERQGQVEPALHAAGVAADAAVGRLGEAHPLQERVATALDLRRSQAVEAALELHVLAPGEQRVERRLLERDADRVADGGPLADDVVAGHAWRCRRWAASRVVSMWTVVDLPAPFGPRKP